MAGDAESPELLCLLALRDARAEFIGNVFSHARMHTTKTKSNLEREEIDLLRSDACFQIAEFYYATNKFQLADRERMRKYLQRHNADMEEQIAKSGKRDAFDMPLARYRECIFTDMQIENAVQHISDGKIFLDQAALGRLLSPIGLSPETIRKTLIALEKAGLVYRIKIGQVLISSPGILEKYFHDHLQLIASRIGNGAKTKKRGAS